MTDHPFIPDVCLTCQGYGLIGGFQFNSEAPGYEVEPCPDCNDGEGNASSTKKEDDAMEQPDPFSELRGLIERATKAVDECPINSKNPRHAQADRSKACKRCGARDNENCGLIDGANYSVAKAAQTLVPALLDERDRLISDTDTLAFERDEFASKATTWEICSDSWKARALSAEGEVEALKEALKRAERALTPFADAEVAFLSAKARHRPGWSPPLRRDFLSEGQFNDAAAAHSIARQALSQEIG